MQHAIPFCSEPCVSCNRRRLPSRSILHYSRIASVIAADIGSSDVIVHGIDQIHVPNQRSCAWLDADGSARNLPFAVHERGGSQRVHEAAMEPRNRESRRGARSRTRTGMALRPADFKSGPGSLLDKGFSACAAPQTVTP
ncbi:hypothetical protein [Lysobacter sp. Root667]|uniref:hypothetical protein n=1 Tax=Lysobacter sp. Root667 TaxID=1736581 RepID=UPI0012DF1799|nr:hypothetical protein [Lysobacter sp. Root667]